MVGQAQRKVPRSLRQDQARKGREKGEEEKEEEATAQGKKLTTTAAATTATTTNRHKWKQGKDEKNSSFATNIFLLFLYL